MAGIMTTVVWVIGALGALWTLHRLALWMESRGWIYYRNARGSSGALGSAFLEVQAMFEPGTRHVIEMKRAERSEDDESGDPPPAGDHMLNAMKG